MPVAVAVGEEEAVGPIADQDSSFHDTLLSLQLAELLDDNTIKSLYGELVRKAENTEINPPFEPTAHTGPPDLAEAVKENNRAKIAHLLIPNR